MTRSIPELSIIVPALNDTAELRGLLSNLAEQIGIDFEVIICDGGTDDDLSELVAEWKRCGSFPLNLLQTGRGRGKQMNAGAAAASAANLLFLHADSRFANPNALSIGLAMYRQHLQVATGPCAARFRLHFLRSEAKPSLAYFFHESKARLNRGDCIRGDQGYLLSRSTFQHFGGFNTDLPFLEDVLLAARIAQTGRWLLLPDLISTSARRFEQEGFYERQVANVIIINAVETGWQELLSALPGLYSCRANGRLQLFPLLNGVRTLIMGHDHSWRKAFWRGTGRHVASNAWQLFFWLDARKAFHSGLSADNTIPHWLDIHDRWLWPLFRSGGAGLVAQLLTRIWLWWLLRRTKEPS